MRKLIWMLAALLTLAPAAFAQTAQEMTDRCAFSSVGKKTLDRMTDGNYQTYWASSSNGSAYEEIEAEDAIGGVYVQFYDDTAALDVQTRDASGAWQTVVQTDGAFLAAYAAVDAGAKTVRIRPKDGKGRLLSQSFASSVRGTRRAGCSNGKHRLKRRICWRWRRIRTTKFCFWAARFPIMRGKWARRCRWPTSCRRCRIGGWNCSTGFGSAG